MTLSGEQLNVEGSPEIAIPDIGVVIFVVVCNMATCDYVISRILCQHDEEGIERLIQYVSAKFSAAEKNMH